jgi:20S proteasome subunit beta 6
VFSFDPVGSYEREKYRAGGSASAMLQPLLDNQIGYLNQTGVEKEPLTIDKGVQLVTDVFISAAERDIYTGDGVKINIITADGVEVKHVPLRRD